MRNPELRDHKQYFRLSRARHAYVCEDCGAPIAKSEPYFRDEPHPMARHYRGERTRLVCTVCVAGRSSSDFIQPRNPLLSHEYWLTRIRPPMESGQLELPLDRGIKSLPGLMLQSAILDCTSVEDGKLIDGVAPAWFAIAGWVEKDPRFIYEIPWRKLEELIAGAYLRDGWTEVTLTPRSRDHGRDVIAIKRGICTIRIIDQVKAYAAGRLVTADEVRALLGVLSSDLNVSKGFVTTTARFAPGIKNDPTICPFIPYRLELRDGTRFTNWLLSVARHRRGGSGDAPKDT